MITRQDLSDYREHSTLIEQQNQKLRLWQDRLKRLEASSGLAHSTDSDLRQQYEQMKSDIKNMSAQAADTIRQITQKSKEVEQLINSIPNTKIRAVMYQRYILGSDWDEVAAVLGMNKRSMYRLHGFGLDFVDKMEQETQNKGISAPETPL